MRAIVFALPLLCLVACQRSAEKPPLPGAERPGDFLVSVDGKLFDDCALSARGPEPTVQEVLDPLAACLAHGDMKGHHIRIVGAADERLSVIFNNQLGWTRAETVARYLEARGVPKDRIILHSRGKRLAVHEARDYGFDRRVDIEIADRSDEVI
jgi:hypothetical protein